MHDVFDDPATTEPSQGEPKTDQQQVPAEREQQAPDGDQQQVEQGAAPPAADTEKHVPLAALEAERKGRQDWKEKAVRYEEEAKQLRERLQERPQQQPQQVDPIVAQQQRLETVILNASERSARKEYGAEVLEKSFDRLKQEFARNPALYQQVMSSADPWDEVVQQGKKLMALDEIGSDPSAYRAKLEAEIRASLQSGGAPAATPAAAPIPASLAGARSSGARGNTFTGPTPLDALFPN